MKVQNNCENCVYKDDDCFCPSNKVCKAFKEKQANYTFKFVAPSDWDPGYGACWCECPASGLTKLGQFCLGVVDNNRCPFLNKNNELIMEGSDQNEDTNKKECI